MKKFELTYVSLHIIGMVLMTLDHLWATLFPYLEILTCVGRIAFPIFAFMIVEGYDHTRNLNKYMQRLLVFALVSEIPFNLMYGGAFVYPVHQNVLWTFLLALCGIRIMDRVRAKKKLWLSILVCAAICLLGLVLGYALFVDFYGCGIVTVFIFYFFDRNRAVSFKHDEKLWPVICFVGQFACLYYINVEILGGFYYNIELFGMHFELVQQSLALLALIPIWLYSGRQGYHAKWFKYFNYAFYPAHCLILALIAMAR